jgi:hypothetical protein
MESFSRFDTTRSIADFSKDEFFVKDVVDMLSSFVLQVTKKITACIFQLGNFYLPIFSF